MINWGYYSELKNWAISNKYIAVMYKPLLYVIGALILVIVAWAIYVMIAKIRG